MGRIAKAEPENFFVASLPAFFGTVQAVEALMKDWDLQVPQALHAAS
jgi:hypothetical protein